MSDLIGQELGPYRILEQIGVGGMASVYKAYHATMDRYVAVKVLPEQMGREAGFRKRFEREAKVIAKLEHVHILPVYDYGEHEGRLYLVMRYVEAGTLKERMAAGPMELDEINRILRQVGGALAYAHRLDVIHRDVKPANVLLDAEGDCYLTDFGLAKMLGASIQLTATGVGMGTPAYMSPEQGQGEKVSARSDIYSLGVVLYEMVTGQVPFEAETPLAVVLKHISAPLPLPTEVKPGVHPAVERVILKALAKNPDDRFQAVDELVAAFESAWAEAGTLPPLAPPPSEAILTPTEATVPSSKPIPVTPDITPTGAEKIKVHPKRMVPGWAFAAGGVALLALVGIVLLVTGVFSGGEEETPAPPEIPAVARQPTPVPTRPVVAGGGAFVDSGSRLGNSNSQGVALGDLDGDSDLDALVGDAGEGAQAWLNDGTGRFSASGQSLMIGNPNIEALALGDLDGDGDLDTFLGNTQGANQVWLNDGGGNFINSGQSLGEAESTTVALADLDGDGDLDALVGNGIQAGQADKVWLNDGTGRFTDSDQSLGNATSWVVAPGDLDGDSDLDVFVASSEISTVWLNDGRGTFSDSGQRIGPLDNVSLALGDLDGDGDLDALLGIAGPSGEPNQVWLNDGTGVFYDSGLTTGESASEGMALGDLDGDGDLDAFVTNSFAQANKVWLNNGMGILSDNGQNLGGADSSSVALGDLDSDGDLDAFVGNNGPNKVWLNQTAIPLAHWPFDGDLKDASGNGYDLQATEENVDFVPGCFGQAIRFNDDPNSYLTRGQDDNVFDFGTRDYSIELWVKFDRIPSQSHEQTLIEKCAEEGGCGVDGWGLTVLPGGNVLFVQNPRHAPVSPLNLDRSDYWYHITTVRQGKTVDLYVNGEKIADEEASDIIDSREPLILGRRIGGQESPLIGALDQVTVYAGALSAAEVQVHFQQGADCASTPMPVTAGEAVALPAPPPASPAERARALAEPILDAIADRPPDFQDDFSDPTSGWPTESTAEGDFWGYHGDAYLLTVTSLHRNPGGDPCLDIGLADRPQFTDYVLELDGQFLSGAEANWHTTFRQVIPELAEEDSAAYVVGFWPTALFDLQSGGEYFAENQSAPSFQGGAATNRVTIVVHGPHIAIYVNGEPLWHAYDRMSVGGTVDLGLGACNNDPTPLQVRFDNLKLWDISDLPLPSP